MSELTTLARPYAKAVFEFALAGSSVEQWFAGLEELGAAFDEPTLGDALALPTLPKDEAVDLLLELSPMAARLPGMKNLLVLLAHNGRLALIPQLEKLFGQHHDAWASTVAVEITSAMPLDESLQDRFEAALEKHLQRKVKISTAVNPSLMGGAIVRAGDLVMDGSVRGRLKRLSEQLLAS